MKLSGYKLLGGGCLTQSPLYASLTVKRKKKKTLFLLFEVVVNFVADYILGYQSCTGY